jgi:ribosomal protein L16 Arg81 hydroxylase
MPISDSFILNNWLPRRPTILRQLIDKATLEKTGIDAVLGACIEPVKAVWYSGNEARDRAQRMLLPRVHEAPALYRRICALSGRQILYFTGLAKVASGFEALRQQLQFGYQWRSFEQFAALATPGSIIETHADLIDSLIIQLEGTRHWKVWDIDKDVGRQVQLNNSDREYRMSGAGDTIIDTELSAGDVLYIPALYPHQALLAGDTTSALSLSVGWAALTPIRILRAAMVNDCRSELDEMFERAPEPYLALIPDPEPGKDPLPHIADCVVAMLDPAQRMRIDRTALMHRLQDVNLGSLAGVTAPGSLSQWKRPTAFAASVA